MKKLNNHKKIVKVNLKKMLMEPCHVVHQCNICTTILQYCMRGHSNDRRCGKEQTIYRLLDTDLLNCELKAETTQPRSQGILPFW